MRINDETVLKKLKEDKDKSKRKNSYKVEYMKHNGKKEILTFSQYYDHSCDIYNPYHVSVYGEDGGNIMSGCGPNIERSYNDLITSLILYFTKARADRDEANSKLGKIGAIIYQPCDDDDDFIDF